MEKMTSKEKELLKTLQAKEKRILRNKKKLMADAENIKIDLLKKWNIDVSAESFFWSMISMTYSIRSIDDSNLLYEYLTSNVIVNGYDEFKKNYGNHNLNS